MAEQIRELDVVTITGTVVEDLGDAVMVEITDGEGRWMAFHVLPKSWVALSDPVAEEGE